MILSHDRRCVATLRIAGRLVGLVRCFGGSLECRHELRLDRG